MNEKQKQFRVGVVVLATMIFGGVLAAINGSSSIGWSPFGPGQYLISIAVPQAPGVDQNTPIRKNGVLIGRVKSIEDIGNGVRVTAKIYGKPLYATFVPHVRTTVLGDATIDFQSSQPAAGTPAVEPGYEFRGYVDPSPFDSLGQLGDLKNEFSAASRSLAQAGDEVALLAKRVNSAFGADSGPGGEGRVKRLLDTTEVAMNQFAETMKSVNEIIGDGPIAATQPMGTTPGQLPTTPVVPGQQPGPDGQNMRQRIRQGLDEFPDAIHEFRITMRDSRNVLQSAERNFKNLEGFTEPLGQKGSQVTDSIVKAVDGIDQLIRDLGEVAHALNNRQGSVGKLIHDPQVYDNLNTLMANANKLIFDLDDLTFKIQPVVHDARIFMDKIATEPGRIISGAVRPSNFK